MDNNFSFKLNAEQVEEMQNAQDDNQEEMEKYLEYKRSQTIAVSAIAEENIIALNKQKAIDDFRESMVTPTTRYHKRRSFIKFLDSLTKRNKKYH